MLTTGINDPLQAGMEAWTHLPAPLALFSISMTLCAIGVVFSTSQMSRTARRLDAGEDAPEPGLACMALIVGLVFFSAASMFFLVA